MEENTSAISEYDTLVLSGGSINGIIIIGGLQYLKDKI